MQSAKESGSNVAASAKAGMEKTKATLQEKAEKMTTRDPLQKEMASAKKEERIHEAERQKQEAKMHNAAAKHASDATGGTYGQDYTTGGDYSTTDPNYMGEEGIGGTGRVGHGHRGPHTGGTGTGTGRGYGTGGTY